MIPGVQSDKDALGEGRIKQCSHRSDDSGLYWCGGNTESSDINDLADIGKLIWWKLLVFVFQIMVTPVALKRVISQDLDLGC